MYSKPSLNWPLKKKTKNWFQNNYRLMQVKLIAEISKGSIMQTFGLHKVTVRYLDICYVYFWVAA